MKALASRRALLKLAAGLPVSMPVFAAMAAGPGRSLSFYPVSNQPRVGHVDSGAIVLVDQDITTFEGDGYYLYPDWGRPVVYEIRRARGRLAFHYPGVADPLWDVTVNSPQARFSGRVEGLLSAGCHDAGIERFMAGGKWPLLEVPAQPLT